MTEEEKLDRANQIARELTTQTTKRGQKTVKGLGKSATQLASAYSYLCKHRDQASFLELLRLIVNSPFATRTNQTRGQYNNMCTVLKKHLKNVSTDDAIEIVGWARRLYGYYY